jgi:hypothetical protein
MTRKGAESEPRLVVTQGSFGGDAPPSVLLHHFAHQVQPLYIPAEELQASDRLLMLG